MNAPMDEAGDGAMHDSGAAPRDEARGGAMDPAGAGPLTAGHTAQLAAALHSAGAIRKATRTATVNGWMLGISAAITALVALGSGAGFLLAAALAFLSWNEIRGRNWLRDFDERGPDVLWKNQVGLMVVLVVYCLRGIRAAGSGELDPSMAELAMLAPDLVDMMTGLTIVVYQGVILVTVILQGSLARFYHRRIALIREFRAGTEPWVARVVRMMENRPGKG